jgi:hypothetical protein
MLQCLVFSPLLQCGFEELQPGKCVTVYNRTLLVYLSESRDILFEIEIGTNGLNGVVTEDIQDFFFPMSPHVPYGLRSFLSRL